MIAATENVFNVTNQSLIIKIHCVYYFYPFNFKATVH